MGVFVKNSMQNAWSKKPFPSWALGKRWTGKVNNFNGCQSDLILTSSGTVGKHTCIYVPSVQCHMMTSLIPYMAFTYCCWDDSTFTANCPYMQTGSYQCCTCLHKDMMCRQMYTQSCLAKDVWHTSVIPLLNALWLAGCGDGLSEWTNPLLKWGGEGQV